MVAMDDVPAVTRAQMREVDRVMTEDLGISLLQMMENAGRALARVVLRLLSSGDVGAAEAPRHRVLVLAGSGGNGGGALVAARRLAGWGVDVHVATTQEPSTLTGAAGHQASTAHTIGIPLTTALPSALCRPHLIIDGLVGYSLQGPLHGRIVDLIEGVGDAAVPVVALDAPSGLDVDTGDAAGAVLTAAATLTLAAPKVGLLRPAARSLVGCLLVADIGVPPVVYTDIGEAGHLPFELSDVLRVEQPDSGPLPGRPRGSRRVSRT